MFFFSYGVSVRLNKFRNFPGTPGSEIRKRSSLCKNYKRGLLQLADEAFRISTMDFY
jgi:hypothetical protein